MLLVLAVGATYVIITAGIDLSVGSVLVFSGVVAAKLMNEVGGDSWGVILLGLAAALAAGLAWGLFNGLLVAKAKIPAFIVTLGTLGMALGAALPDHRRRRRARGAVQARLGRSGSGASPASPTSC